MPNYRDQTAKQKCRQVWREFVQIATRQLPSEGHVTAWKFYECEVLTMRAMMYLIARNSFTFIAVMSGNEVYDASARYLDTGGPVGAEKARQFYPNAKIAVQIGLVLRVILLVAAIKYR